MVYLHLLHLQIHWWAATLQQAACLTTRGSLRLRRATGDPTRWHIAQNLRREGELQAGHKVQSLGTRSYMAQAMVQLGQTWSNGQSNVVQLNE